MGLLPVLCTSVHLNLVIRPPPPPFLKGGGVVVLLRKAWEVPERVTKE